jgi:hypothetical protein
MDTILFMHIMLGHFRSHGRRRVYPVAFLRRKLLGAQYRVFS